MFVTLYETGEVQFCLFGTNGFHVKAENEKFMAVDSLCRQNLKCENFTSSFEGANGGTQLSVNIVLLRFVNANVIHHF